MIIPEFLTTRTTKYNFCWAKELTYGIWITKSEPHTIELVFVKGNRVYFIDSNWIDQLGKQRMNKGVCAIRKTFSSWKHRSHKMNKVISRQDNPISTGFNDRNSIKSLKWIGYLKGDTNQIRYTSKPAQQGVFIWMNYYKEGLRSVPCIEISSVKPVFFLLFLLVLEERIKAVRFVAQWSLTSWKLHKHINKWKWKNTFLKTFTDICKIDHLSRWDGKRTDQPRLY